MTMRCEKCGAMSANPNRCSACGASLTKKFTVPAPTTGIVTVDGTRRAMSMITQEAIITRVEKWETMNASISTQVSGGGGYIHNGTGHINGINSTTMTNIESQRNVRVYYEGADGVERNLTYTGGDLDVTEGSPIVIEWYCLEGFQEQVAGFFNRKNQCWY